MYRSILCPSIFNRLRAIAGYWSEIANFSYPLHLTPPLGVILLDDLRDFWWLSCRMARLQYGAKYLRKVKPLSRVHARHRRQTDRQTDLPCH